MTFNRQMWEHFQSSHLILSKRANISQDRKASNAFIFYFHFLCLKSLPSFSRLLDLLWLRHVAQWGAPASSPGWFKQQQHRGTEQERKRPAELRLPREDQPVLKFTSLRADSVRRQMHRAALALTLIQPHHSVPQTQEHSVYVSIVYQMTAWWRAALSVWWQHVL